MLASERHEKILQYLKVHTHVKIGELSIMLGVTEPTLRSDFSYLEDLGKLIKIRGGAASVHLGGGDISLKVRSETMGKEKKLLAQELLAAIPDNSVIFMDAATTVLKVAQELAFDKEKKLTVVTHFLDIAQVLLSNPRITVVFCGGVISNSNRCCLGEDTLKVFASYYADIALLGCQGITQDNGFFNGSLDTSAAKKIMHENSGKTWICADHSKFGRKGIIRFLSFDEVDALFTDFVPENWKPFFKANQFSVHTPKV